MCVFDNLDAFNWHEERQERMLAKRPKCRDCGEPIQDEYCYNYEGDLICMNCMDDYRVSTEDYER